ncbi:hypothetical protein HDU92_004002 [Lobulomyces angularis]|nr:hypothetical protein HDU92_004002 [Lobulomyces angularis]
MLSTLILSTLLLSSLKSTSVRLTHDLRSNNLVDHFDFFTGADPTHGFVKYVDRDTAFREGLVKNEGGRFILKSDTGEIAFNGRKSVRIESKQAFNRRTLIMLDLDHMPTGCGTWPAFWMFGPNWPNSGEVDIIEGVNQQEKNLYTLHTSDGCMQNGEGQTSKLITPNCYVNAPGQFDNQGCAMESNTNLSFGKGFNQNKGGVFATLWVDDAIKIWFFPRGSIPGDILNGNLNVDSWGAPSANFKTEGNCSPNKFRDMKIIFNLTFCGDWAGNAYQGCPGTCVDFVKNNPAQFNEAFFSVNYLKIYAVV